MRKKMITVVSMSVLLAFLFLNVTAFQQTTGKGTALTDGSMSKNVLMDTPLLADLTSATPGAATPAPTAVLTVGPTTGTAMGFTYMITDDNEIFISAYTGKGGTVTVPDTINGYKVVGFSTSVFSGNKTITEVDLPDTITEDRKSVV